ncbi:hypothetical protein KC19_VG092800 [Ceratodon purpureus]|uniref:Uncharacterized protein n=1 Tax=Ceratodon purpureus TaxID=3225 RepID=A0A8T0HNN5_CERPU|nr:hypothetical protein KC19_VG092800 [Ceratodon purpureus]
MLKMQDKSHMQDEHVQTFTSGFTQPLSTRRSKPVRQQASQSWLACGHHRFHDLLTNCRLLHSDHSLLLSRIDITNNIIAGSNRSTNYLVKMMKKKVHRNPPNTSTAI